MALSLFPSEVWMQVFCYACLDDGSTGRALSNVSRDFRDLSREYKLQCLALVGYSQILGCADMLENTPPEFRNVRHLFLTVPQDEGARNVVDYHKDKEKFDTLVEAYKRIMFAVAPSLRSFYCVHTIARYSVLLPCSMPLLESLTIHGPSPPNPPPLDSQLPVFPSLRHFCLRDFYDYPSRLFEYITVQAPNITHLYLMPYQIPRRLNDDLRHAFDAPRSRRHVSPDSGKGPRKNFPSSRSSSGRSGSSTLAREPVLLGAGSLPPTIERVVIQPGAQPGAQEERPFLSSSYQDMMDRLSRFSDKRVQIGGQSGKGDGRGCQPSYLLQRWLETLSFAHAPCCPG